MSAPLNSLGTAYCTAQLPGGTPMWARDKTASAERSCACMCMLGLEYDGVQLGDVKGIILLRAQARKRGSSHGHGTRGG